MLNGCKYRVKKEERSHIIVTYLVAAKDDKELAEALALDDGRVEIADSEDLHSKPQQVVSIEELVDGKWVKVCNKLWSNQGN